MNAVYLMCGALACFILGFLFYSKLIGKLVGVDPGRPTPAHTQYDGIDYVPAHPAVLFGHHFAAIAGAGPIVGPIFAAEFGWGAVALWVILGCIFIGSMHDMVALFLSVRHKGQSIGTVIGDVLGRPGKFLFLLFCWSTLVLVCAEFTRQIAATFVQQPGIATASLLFIAEAVFFGLCVYRLHWSVLWSSLIFVPLVFASCWIGELLPIDLVKSCGLTPEATQTVWTLVLLAYCFLASTLPVWLLLQPRDYLNSYLLYAMMALGFLGILFAHPTLHMEAFSGFRAINAVGHTDYLFPFLFVTVACGACSGFHALVASGTTAKQLDSEKHLRMIGYGGMLLEGVLAIIALIGVAGTYSHSEYIDALKAVNNAPVQVFASTIAAFCAKLGIPVALAKSFMLLAVSAFLMTSVDAATRLARFTWQELFVPFAEPGDEAAPAKMTGARAFCHNMYFGTAVVCALVVVLLLGNPKAAKSLWTTFASSNQLLAALTLMTATMYFLRRYCKAWLVTVAPTLVMFSVAGTATFMLMVNSQGMLRYVCTVLFCMAVCLLGLALRTLAKKQQAA